MIRPVTELDSVDYSEIDAEIIREALERLATRDYEIRHNGYKLVLLGERTWTWRKTP